MFQFFSSGMRFCLVPNECLNELEGIRHFERVFQDRYPNVLRWPVWFKSSLENAINQSVKHSFLTFVYFYFFSMVHSLSFSIMMNLLLLKYFLVKFFVHHRF
jgi:hypothetical protein